MRRCPLTFVKKYEHKFWVNYTGCLNNIRQTERQIEEVNDLKLILRQLTRNEIELTHTRNKRGVFNFSGGISKLLFGLWIIKILIIILTKFQIWKMSNWTF